MPRNIVLNKLLANNKEKSLAQNIWGSGAFEAVKDALSEAGKKSSLDNNYGYSPVHKVSMGTGSYKTFSFGEGVINRHFNEAFESSFCNAVEVYKIPRCEFHNWNGYHVLKSDDVLYEFSSAYAPLCELWFPLVSELKTSICLDAAFVLFDDSDPLNYAHFILDYLNKIYIYQSMGLKIPVIIPQGLNRLFHTDVFDALRSQGVVFIMVPEGATVIVDSLYVVKNPSSQSHPAFKGSIDAIKFIRNQFGINDFNLSDLKDEICWISRSDSRKIVNEDSLINIALKLKKVFVTDLSDYSIFEQAKIFSTYKYIIGPHGAAFTNSIFSNSGVRLCEIFAPSNGTVAFSVISNSIGVKHYSYFGKIQSREQINYPDILVNEFEFEKFMKIFLET